MSAPSALLAALEGTRRLIRLDDSALSFFDQSAQGFWKSFDAVALIIAAHLVAFILFSAPANLFHGISREILTGIILWLAYPLIAHYLVIYLDRSDRYFTYIVPFNWLRLPLNLASLIAALLALTNSGLTFLFYLCIGAWIFYHWRLVRTSLGVSASMALALTLFEFFFTLIVQSSILATSKMLLTP